MPSIGILGSPVTDARSLVTLTWLSVLKTDTSATAQPVTVDSAISSLLRFVMRYFEMKSSRETRTQR